MASGLSDGEEEGLTTEGLREFVARDVALQTQDVSSMLDQRKVLEQAKKKYKSKGLSDAYVPSSKTITSTGEHLCGCPCAICVDLEGSLSPADLETTRKVRALKGWTCKGQIRPVCLLLPAKIPDSGSQRAP